MQLEMRDFHFERGEIQKTVYNLGQYIKLMSGMNFVYPMYDALRYQAIHSNMNTFAYR